MARRTALTLVCAGALALTACLPAPPPDDPPDTEPADTQDDGGGESDPVLDYLDQQTTAMQQALDGDEDAADTITDLDAEYIYTPEPGDPDGEWVHDWSHPGDCPEVLDDDELCDVVAQVRNKSVDVEYYLDDPEPDPDAWCERWYPDDPAEFCDDERGWWHDDRDAALDDTRTAINAAEEALEERR